MKVIMAALALLVLLFPATSAAGDARDEYTKEHCGKPTTKQKREVPKDGMQA